MGRRGATDRRSMRRVRRPGGTRPRVRIVTMLALVGLLAASCGGDHGEADAPTTTQGDGGSTTSAPAAEGTTFGTLASPCGDGDAKGATAQGVTDASIEIGYGDDAGYAAAPGLDKEMSDAVEAMIDWCNEQGGI